MTSLNELISLLHASAGEDNYFHAVFKRVPLLFKVTAADPPGYMFKLRMVKFHRETSDWHESLDESCRAANISCELEDEYLFVWVRNPGALESSGIVEVLGRCIEDHAEYFPGTDAWCYNCQGSGSATLIQSRTAVTALCPACRSAKVTERAVTEKRLNESNGALILLLPLALLMSSVGWALFWNLYQMLFELLNVQRIVVPQLLIALVVTGVGFGLGWPVGTMLHRAGVSKRVPAPLLAAAIALVSAGIGEYLGASALNARLSIDYGWDQTLHTMAQINSPENGFYLLLKFLVLIALAISIHQFCRLKKVCLSI